MTRRKNKILFELVESRSEMLRLTYFEIFPNLCPSSLKLITRRKCLYFNKITTAKKEVRQQ